MLLDWCFLLRMQVLWIFESTSSSIEMHCDIYDTLRLQNLKICRNSEVLRLTDPELEYADAYPSHSRCKRRKTSETIQIQSHSMLQGAQ
jgi:hypothetical protein